MTAIYCDHEQMIAALNATVAEAEAFFHCADKPLRGREQSAREAFAHLVFWHLDYVYVSEAPVTGGPHLLRTGTFWQLNALAPRQARDEPMRMLARRLSYQPKNLAKVLRQLQDWSRNFPVKKGAISAALRSPRLKSKHISLALSHASTASGAEQGRRHHGNRLRLRAHGAPCSERS